MSVILDALQKARADRRKNQAETHPNSVAKVLEPALNGPGENASIRKANGKGWIVPVSIIFGVLCLLALAGGAFFMLYDQIRRMEKPVAPTQHAVQPNDSGQPVSTAQPLSTQASPVVAAPSNSTPASLSTPVPLADLPVQTPAPPSDLPAAAAGAVPTPAGLKLGSIACEANEDDCIAHINGRIVKVGDRVKQFQVMKITADAVILRGNSGDVVTLSLFD